MYHFLNDCWVIPVNTGWYVIRFFLSHDHPFLYPQCHIPPNMTFYFLNVLGMKIDKTSFITFLNNPKIELVGSVRHKNNTNCPI